VVQVLDVPVFSQSDTSAKLPNMCVCCALGMALVGSGIHPNITTNDIIDKALVLGITSYDGGISSAGLVRIAREYGTAVYGCIGEHMNDANEGPQIIRSHLAKGYPVIVFSRTNLKPTGIGHAHVITGIDDKNNLKIYDSHSYRTCPSVHFSSPLSSELPPDLPSTWIYRGGQFLCTWLEFDACWNTVDTDFSVPDWAWDSEGIFELFREKQWRRFWLCVYPGEIREGNGREGEEGREITSILGELMKMGFAQGLANEAAFVTENLEQAVSYCIENALSSGTLI